MAEIVFCVSQVYVLCIIGTSSHSFHLRGGNKKEAIERCEARAGFRSYLKHQPIRRYLE